MQYGKVAGIDKPISRLAQGTVMLNTRELDKGFALLDDIFGLGCTTFDTAQSYGGGESERTIGRWMEARGNRDKVVIITKAAHPSLDRKRVTPFDISSDLHDSLARLKTDYIDLYLLHRDDPTLPVGPLVEVLNEHHRAGKIRVFGGSNWTHQRVQEANEYAAAHGLVPFTISSPNFSLAEQFKPPWPECLTISGPQNADAREWYVKNQMPLFTWSSLAGGFFSGRFTRDNLKSFDNALDKVCIEAYCYEPNFKRLDRVRQLAQEKGLTIPQIATAYVMSQPLNIFAIVGSATGAEFKQNMEASDLRLSPEEIAWLELKTDDLGVTV
jgi:aryl-alcohol dehydrogenase-like predicted oxidoreductase